MLDVELFESLLDQFGCPLDGGHICLDDYCFSPVLTYCVCNTGCPRGAGIRNMVDYHECSIASQSGSNAGTDAGLFA